MPVYTYHCDSCEHEFDQHQSFNEDSLSVCPVCRKHQLRKVYKPARIVFKGSGFYVTDKKARSSTAKAASKKPDGKKDTDKKASKDDKPKSKETSVESKSKKTKVSES